MKESSLVPGMSVSSTTVDRFLSSPSANDLIRLLRGDADLGEYRLVCVDDKVVVKLLHSLIRLSKDSDEYVSEFVLGNRSDLLPVLFRFDRRFGFNPSCVVDFCPTESELNSLPESKVRRYRVSSEVRAKMDQLFADRVLG